MAQKQRSIRQIVFKTGIKINNRLFNPGEKVNPHHNHFSREFCEFLETQELVEIKYY